jgi:hypothetical protein
MLVCGRKLLFNKLEVGKRYTKGLGVLSVLRNEVEIERCVTVHQHVHHCGLPKGFLIHCRASIE